MGSILILLAYNFIFKKVELYGNDPQSIIKVIRDFESYANSEIIILDIKDHNDARVVAFLANNSPSYLELYRNEQGNYLPRTVGSQNTGAFAMFLPSRTREFNKILFVTNDQHNVSKMQVDINEIPIEQTFTPFQAAATWVDLPQRKNGQLEYRNYRYYDEHGELME